MVGAIAVAAGAAVGMALPSTPQEDRLLGETRQNVMETAKETAQEVSEKVQKVAEETQSAAQKDCQRAEAHNVAKCVGALPMRERPHTSHSTEICPGFGGRKRPRQPRHRPLD